ncbi:hypothetical protein F2Q69_00022862 [Brassica cretica]|uniref:Uncharacterized protein n=1 Tax=Brassica cretica TaxID=69181 RepID=A0A8S9QFB3_BRACR|nr:hypothetical protein F2Q69_00022862 [Brassica cretica]
MIDTPKVKPALLFMLSNEVGIGECQTRVAKLLARFRYVLEKYGYRFELAFQCHRFEVNQHHVAEVMPVLLKSRQSASREEAVEEMKDCRSMKQHWCRSTVMPEYGMSIFYDRLKPRSNHKLPECPWMT